MVFDDDQNNPNQEHDEKSSPSFHTDQFQIMPANIK